MDTQNQNLISKYREFIIVATVVLFTYFTFSGVISCGILNYDDGDLAFKNKFVLGYVKQGLSAFKNPEVLLRDPVTLWSHGVVIKLFGPGAAPAHFINLLLHLLNIVLVYVITKKLAKKIKLATIATILFAVHPFRLESVAWIAERKDMLMAFFFLLGILFYLFYIEKKNTKLSYLLIIVFSVLALYSKAAAIIFPVCLFAIDYYYGRKLTKALFIEKIPIFIIPAFYAVLQLSPNILRDVKYHQSRPEGFTQDFIAFFEYNYFDRIFLAAFSFLFYFFSSVAPLYQTPIHSYPMKIDGVLPWYYYASAVVVIIIAIGIFILFKKTKIQRKPIIFGLLFFLICISITLHFFAIGGVAVVCERYTYLGYYGLFFLLASIVTQIIESQNLSSGFKNGFIGFVVLYILFFAVNTYSRTSIYKDSINFFTEVISKNKYIGLAYNNRANAKFESGDYQGALADMDKAIKLVANTPDVWHNRGFYKYMMGDLTGAMKDFDKAIEIYPNHIISLFNRGTIKSEMKDYDGFFTDINKIIKLEPDNWQALYNRARVYLELKRKGDALNDINKIISLNREEPVALYMRSVLVNDKVFALDNLNRAIQYNPKYADAYFQRGMIKKDLKMYNGAIYDIAKSLDLKMEEVASKQIMPNNPYIELKSVLDLSSKQNRAYMYYTLGRLQLQFGKKNEAITSFNESLKIFNEDYDAYYYRGLAKTDLKDFKGALQDFNTVINLNPGRLVAYFSRGNIYYLTGKFNDALNDYNKVIEKEPTANLFSNRGNIYLTQKNYKLAIADYNEAIKLDNKKADYYYNRGIAFYYASNKPEACTDFKKAAELGYKKAVETYQKFCN